MKQSELMFRAKNSLLYPNMIEMCFHKPYINVKSVTWSMVQNIMQDIPRKRLCIGSITIMQQRSK